MQIWDDWKLDITVDQVLRAQGCDPTETRRLRPALVEMAQRAISEYSSYLTPKVGIEEFAIISHLHTYLLLQDNLSLHGAAIVKALADADSLICGIATLGPALEAAVDRSIAVDPALGLAVDGLGNAALDLLQIEACRRIEQRASARGKHASILFSPGMVGWELIESQPQVYELAPAEAVGVAMNNDLQMIPTKSISFVLGLSGHPFGETSMCSVCGLQGICRYRGTGDHG